LQALFIVTVVTVAAAAFGDLAIAGSVFDLTSWYYRPLYNGAPLGTEVPKPVLVETTRYGESKEERRLINLALKIARCILRSTTPFSKVFYIAAHAALARVSNQSPRGP
jgi:hypothetical protein